jgi:hypothetical protein
VKEEAKTYVQKLYSKKQKDKITEKVEKRGGINECDKNLYN